MHVGTRKNWHNKFITLSVLLNKHWHAIKFTMSHLICPRGNMRTQRTLYYVFHKLTLVKGALHNWPRRTQHCSLCACTTLTLLAEQVFETCRVRACKAVHIVRQKFGSVCDVLSCDDIERCRLFIGNISRVAVHFAAGVVDQGCMVFSLPAASGGAPRGLVAQRGECVAEVHTVAILSHMSIGDHDVVTLP